MYTEALEEYLNEKWRANFVNEEEKRNNHQVFFLLKLKYKY